MDHQAFNPLNGREHAINLDSRSSSLRAALAVFLALYAPCFSSAVEIATPPACVAPPSGLVSWWRGEGNGSDATGGHDAVLLNGVGFAPSEVGQGFSFDGLDDRVIVSSTPSLNFGPGQDFSIEAWIQPLAAVTDFGVQSIVDKRLAPNISQGQGYEFDVVNGRVSCRLSDSIADVGTGYGPAGPDLRDGLFHHVAMTVNRNSTTGGRLYVDGQMVLEFDPTGEPGDLSTSEPLRIGNHATPSLMAFYKGVIDEVSVYNRALSANDIAGIYAAGSAGKCVGTNPPAGTTAFLLNVNFGAHLNPGSLSAIKVGLAATGATTNDFWNFYSRDGNSAFDWLVNSALPNLELADGTPTAAGLVVNNAPGCWSDGSSDAMYNSYIYPFDSGNATVRFTNLPAGQFDVYVYGPDGNYELAVGGVSQGVRHTLDPAPVNPPVWMQGVQYARFTNANVSVGVPLVVTVRPGVYGYAVISGMQIVSSAATNVVLPTNCLTAPSGLVSWWRAESNVVDSVAGNHGALVGNAAYAAGRVGQAFSFDGNGDAIFIGNPANLQLQNLTIEGWVKRSSTTQVSASSIYGEIVGYGPGGYVIGFRQDGSLFLSKNDVSDVRSVGTITDTVWHHVAVTKNGSAVVFYLDGVADSVITYDTTFEFTTDLRIGAVNSGAEASFLGMIDELSIYNRALTPGEVQSIYNAGSAGKCPPPSPSSCVPAPTGLVSWWQGESNASDSANSNHGTLAGNTSFGAGRVGQGFVFDGNGDHVPVGNPANLRLQDFTIEAWIKRASTSVVTFGNYGNGIIFGYGQGGYGLYLDANGTPVLSKIGISGVQPAVTVNIADTSFHHLAVTKTGSTVVFYLDGVAYSAAAYDPGFDFSTDAAIGARGDNLDNSFFGVIDEVAVYNRALSASEVQSIYSAGSAGKCPPPPPTTCVPAPSGLVSWWRAETNALDSVDGNHGSLIGNAAYAAGRVGQAFSFDGNGDSIFIGNPANLQLQNLTIEGWVKRSSTSQVSASSIYGEIVGYGPGGYVLGFQQDGYLFLSKNNVSAVWSVGTLTDTAWHHVAVTKNGSTVVFYLDGVAEPSITYVTTFEFTTDLRIGAVNSGAEASFLGMIDELSIYNRALSAGELQSIYNADGAGKCPPPPPTTCVPAPAGLVSWWPGEGNANDSADGNHGTLQNGATLVAGKVGQAFSLDGVNDFVSVPDAPNLRFGPSSPMTVDMWVYRTSSNPIQHMLAKRAGCTGSSTEGTYQLALNMNTGTGLSFANPGGSCACSGQDLPLNTWTHLAGTFDGTTLRLFVNGQLAATTTGSLGPANTAPLKIGDAGSCGADYGAGFGGLIDEVSIYNRALSTNEIQAIYNAGSAGKCPPPPLVTCVPAPSGLVSWWQAEGNAVDTSGSNSGQLTGNAMFASGEVGQAFVFDGVDGFITVPASPSLNVGLGAGLTIETWIKPSAIDLERPIAEWNSVTGGNPYPYGVHFWISVPVGYGAGPGCLYANLVDTAGNFHWLTSAGGLIDTNSFQHVAVTYDQSSGLAVLLLNGAVVAQQNLGSFTPQTGYNLYLGSRPGGTAAAYRWAGLMDEVSLYSRALNQSEIQSIYAAGSAGKCVASNPPPVLAPVITAQPTNVTVYVGSNATFRVTATSDAPLSYQWRFDGHDLPGKTSSVLSLTGVQSSNAGPYFVVVSNAGGVVTSSNAVLTVNPLPNCVPPPAGLVSWWRAENDTTDSSGSNNGTTQIRAYVAGKVGRAFYFPGFTVLDSSSLRITNAFTIEAWVNRSSVYGSAPGTIISKFDYPLAQPVGTQSAYLLGTTNNGRLFFTVSATGSARTNTMLVTSQALPINQWSFVVATYDGAALRIYLNGAMVAQTNYSGGIFPGAANLGLGAIPVGTSSFWPFSGLLDEVSLYNHALTDGEIQAIFNADVVGKCLVAPTIVTQPQDQAIPLGEDVKFTVSVLGNRPLKYQWRFNGTNLAGATNSALVLEKLQTNRAGNYSVFVSNAVGTATSSNAALTLLPAPVCTETPEGLISWWPADTNLFDVMGTNNISLFTPAAYVTGKVARAFSFNGASSRIQINSSASLNFGSNADFSIEMWIKTGASNSANPNVPLFEKRTTTSIWSGYSLSLNQGRLAFALGSLPLISGTTVSMFTSPGPDLRDAMFHHVAVSVIRTATNGGNLYVDGQLVLTFDPTPRNGSLITSNPLYLGAPATTISNSYFGGQIDEPAIYNRALTAAEVLAIRQAGAAGKCKMPPSILVPPVNQRVTLGSNVTFSVVAAGTPLLRYQWFKNNQILGNAANATLQLSSITDAAGGNYSVRVTNLFGVVISSNAVLSVNHVPAASSQDVSLDEDTPTLITLIGSDPDDNALTYPIVTPPAHGGLSGTGSNVVYTPNPNYNGPDSFTFLVNDGLVDSAPATVSLTILPVNDAPVAFPQTVALNEDTTVAITLGAFDVEGDPLTFTVGTPAHGTLSGAAPNLTYTPHANYFGPDGFTFKVNDEQADSAWATVSLNVMAVNDAPVARCKDVTVPADTNWQANASIDDGSSDPDTGDTLTLTQTPAGPYALGTNAITLTVTDSHGASNSCTATVTVLGARRAKEDVLAELIALRATVTNQHDGQKLDEAIEHLSKSLAAELWVDQTHLERKHGDQVFQEEKETVKKLCDLIKSKQSNIPDAVLQDFIDRIFRADRLLASVAIQEAIAAGVSPKKIEQAQKYLAKGDADAGDEKCDNGIEDYGNAWKHAVRAKISSPVHLANGHTQLEVLGAPGERLTIQASSNLVDWVTIGSGTANAGGVVTFDDATAGQHPVRYYRAISE